MKFFILLALFSLTLAKVYKAPVQQAPWREEGLLGPSIPEPVPEPNPLPALRASSFSCQGRGYGYYADVDNDCTAFVVCQTVLSPEGVEEVRGDTFRCGPGTAFDQKLATCVDEKEALPCHQAPSYYDSTAERFAIIPKVKQEEYTARKVHYGVPVSQQKFVQEKAPVVHVQEPIVHQQKVEVREPQVHQQKVEVQEPQIQQVVDVQAPVQEYESVKEFARATPEEEVVEPHILTTFVASNFDCNGHSYGYYADVANNCQAYHLCLPSKTPEGFDQIQQTRLACSPGTRFDQKLAVCTFEEEAMDCSQSPQFFAQTAQRFAAERPEDRLPEYIRGKVNFEGPITQVKGVPETDFLPPTKGGVKGRKTPFYARKN